MHASNVIPFRPFQSVAIQLSRMGLPRDRRPAFFTRIHSALAAGGDGKRIAADVRAAQYDSGHGTHGGAA